MEVRYCEVDQVQIGNRLRSLDPDKVASLAESMDAIGLQQPISVWSDNIETLQLVAGLHRLEAARKLGWEDIDCIFVNLDDLDRQLWEIDENLMRAELGPAEMAEHLKLRKVSWDKRQSKEVSGQVDPKPQGGRPEGFAKDTEDKTGTSKRTTNRAVARGEAIPADVLARIRGTELDTGRYLDRLKKLSRDEMREEVDHGMEFMEHRQLRIEEDRRKKETFKSLFEEAFKNDDLKDHPILFDITWSFPDELKHRIVSLGIDAKNLALLFNQCWEFAGKPDSAEEDWWEPIEQILDLIESEEATVEYAMRQIITAIQKEKDQEKAKREEEERREAEEEEREWREREPCEFFAEYLLEDQDSYDEQKYARLIRHLKNCRLTNLVTAVEKMQTR